MLCVSPGFSLPLRARRRLCGASEGLGAGGPSTGHVLGPWSRRCGEFDISFDILISQQDGDAEMRAITNGLYADSLGSLSTEHYDVGVNKELFSIYPFSSTPFAIGAVFINAYIDISLSSNSLTNRNYFPFIASVLCRRDASATRLQMLVAISSRKQPQSKTVSIGDMDTSTKSLSSRPKRAIK